MGMNIGANDVNNMLTKSSMVGGTQPLRVDQRVKDTDKTRESRDVEGEGEGSQDQVSIGRAPQQAPLPRRLQTANQQGAQRLEQGGVEWNEQGAPAELPQELQAKARGASSRADYNIPFWLRNQQTERPGTDNPLVAHRRLLNGLSKMLHTEIQQYVKSNSPTYSKSTLREFYDLVGEKKRESAPRFTTLRGDPLGLNEKNWNDLGNVVTMFQNPPLPGDAFDKVA